jgi:hypothetical protein
MSAAKKTEEIKVRLILEVFQKLEENAKKNAELLTSIREKISCLDLEQTIPVKKPIAGCHDGFLNGRRSTK